jgi:hypothetical protein
MATLCTVTGNLSTGLLCSNRHRMLGIALTPVEVTTCGVAISICTGASQEALRKDRVAPERGRFEEVRLTHKKDTSGGELRSSHVQGT